MKIIPAYWAYVDRNNDGKWEPLRVTRDEKWAKKLTIFEVRREQKLAKAGGYGFRSKRIPARKPSPTALDSLITLARAQLGVTDGGNNNTKYGKWYGMNYAAWCCILISWLCWKVGIPFHYAYVPYVVADARAYKNGLSTTNKPFPGCLVCYDFDGGVADHIGIFLGWLPDGRFLALEGNTSDSDWTNGDTVAIKKRHRDQVEEFVVLPKAA